MEKNLSLTSPTHPQFALELESYPMNQSISPHDGLYLSGYQSQDCIVVYQAYRASIADFAVKHQFLGGDDFSYNRMSWIKPNFMWMMFRCGWCEKEKQERVLALWIKKQDFESILNVAVYSTYKQEYYQTEANWKEALKDKEVRLQWDPEHHPSGEKIHRRVIQLGLKGETLKHFCQKQIQYIMDITDFVKEQKQSLDTDGIENLLMPTERAYDLADENLKRRLGIVQGRSKSNAT